MIPEYTIIGSGISGIILFKELQKLNKTVNIIESNYNELNKGSIHNDSLKHENIDTHRVRNVGGTSNLWGAGCTLFEPEDFKNWPFDFNEFEKYYIQACKTLNINYENYKNKDNIFDKKFVSDIFYESNYINCGLTQNKFINHILNTNELKQKFIQCLLNDLTLVKIKKNKLILKNKDNKIIELKYNKCILCMGGLECPRILLESNFTNENIGKFYSPHINIHYGRIIMNENVNKLPTSYNNKTRYLLYKNKDKPIVRIIIQNNMNIICQSDQTPNKNSGIQLDDNDKDVFECKKIILKHSVHDSDFQNIIDCYTYLNDELKKNNIGYIEQIPNIEDLKNNINGASHFMGMTRMSNDKNNGVVDKNLKVYNTNNIYILSTSIFPSYSHAQPSLTLVALIYYYLDTIKQNMINTDDITFTRGGSINIKNYDNPWNNRNIWCSSISIDLIKNLLGTDINYIIEFGSYDGGDGIKYKYNFPNSNVYSIEASKNCYNKIKTLEKYGINVFNYAISNHNGEIEFYETFDHNNNNYAPCGSVNKDYCSTTQASHEKPLEILHPIKIPCITVSSFCKEQNIPYIDLIHIDVEGHAFEAIEGFGEIRPKLVYVEVKSDTHDHSGKISSLLNKMKYNLLINMTSDQLWIYNNS